MLQSRKSIDDVELKIAHPNHAANPRKRIYSLAVTLDGSKLVTSSEAGLTTRKISDLTVVETRPLPLFEDKFGSEKTSPYWGVSFSPSGSALVAVNGEGTVDTFALVHPIMVPDNNEESRSNAGKIAESLVEWSSRDGLRGIWDVQASIVTGNCAWCPG